MPRWMNLANLLTLLRLALVPFIIRAIMQEQHMLALSLFAAAAVTDMLDGLAARRLTQVTPAGAWLDPVADKVLLSGVYLALAVAHIVPFWFVVIVFGRDLYILLGAAAVALATPIRQFPPSVWGKASTFVQIVTVVVWMARDVLQVPVLAELSRVMLWPCAAFTVWSGLDYTWRGAQKLRMH